MMLHMRYDDTCMCEMATVAASKASEVKKGLAAGVDDGKRAAAALTQHHVCTPMRYAARLARVAQDATADA